MRALHNIWLSFLLICANVVCGMAICVVALLDRDEEEEF